MTCGRNPGTFREPVYILKEKAGYIDCKMNWKSKRLIIKERNIFNHDFIDCKAIDFAIEELAKFHEAKEIVET